jgi:galactose oxidase
MPESQGVTSSSSLDVSTDVAPCCAAAPAPSECAQSAREGRWDDVFYLPNVAIHTHVLPDGKVLFWGRRDRPDGSMSEHECTPYVWDPEAQTFFQTPQPMLSNEQTKVNLFCSGHAFLPDGKLLVAGGHFRRHARR